MTSPRRVLVIGSGAREHALAWRLATDPEVGTVDIAPGSDAMADVGMVWPQVAATDADAIVELSRGLEPDLVVVGPEAPLADGLVDRLAEVGVLAFGPTGAAARLEASKAYCREIAERAGIPMADGAAFDEVGAALAFARSLGPPVVVKADGLAAGKGVTVCSTLDEAEQAIRAAIEYGAFGYAGRRVIVERALAGVELSLIAICDGRAAVALPTARDHKRLADGDTGPNTGGMGAVSPAPGVSPSEVDRLLATFHRPALRELQDRGTPFRGALYAGLMLTADGPRLLEFNVRFGDPETQAMIPRLQAPFGSLLLAAAAGRLAEWETWAPGANPLDEDPARPSAAAVAVVLAAAGYPGTPAIGDPIDGLEAATGQGSLVFHGATRRAGSEFLTSGGRVLTVVGRGGTPSAAREAAYDAVAAIRFTGRHYRRDIGSVHAAADLVGAGAAAPVGVGQP